MLVGGNVSAGGAGTMLQRLMTSAPCLETADSLIMGLVGSPVGFASAHSTSRELQIRIQQTMPLFKLDASGDTEVPAFILKE